MAAASGGRGAARQIGSTMTGRPNGSASRITVATRSAQTARSPAGVSHGISTLTPSTPSAAARATEVIRTCRAAGAPRQYESMVSSRAGAPRYANSAVVRSATRGPSRKPSQASGRNRATIATGSSRPATRPSIVPWSTGRMTERPSAANSRPSRNSLPEEAAVKMCAGALAGLLAFIENFLS